MRWRPIRESATQADLSERAVLLVRAAVLFFVLWLVLAYFLNAWSRRQDETGDPRYARWLDNLSGPGLVVFGITITSPPWTGSCRSSRPFARPSSARCWPRGNSCTGFALVLIVAGLAGPGRR